MELDTDVIGFGKAEIVPNGSCNSLQWRLEFPPVRWLSIGYGRETVEVKLDTTIIAHQSIPEEEMETLRSLGKIKTHVYTYESAECSFG